MLTVRAIEAIVGKEWENYKKKLDKDELYLRLKKIFKLKNIEYKIKELKFGRTLHQEVIEIEIANRKYILPNTILIDKTINELCKENFEYSFYLDGKFLPRSISYKTINELYTDYIESKNYNAYFKYLDEFYNIDNLSIIIERTIIENKDFTEYREIIDESISMYLKENYFSAISLLIPCIEGILRKIINTHLGEENYYKEKDYLVKALNVMLDSWGEIIYPKEKFWFPKEIFESKKYLYMFDLIPVMAHGLFSYLEDFFYGNIEKFKKKYGDETLNRHLIVHGYSTNYGTKNNWLLLFGILDSLLLISRKFEIFRPSHNFFSILKGQEYRMKKNIIKEHEKIYLFNKEEEILKISKDIREAIIEGTTKMKNDSKKYPFLKEDDRYSLISYIEKEIKVKIPIFSWMSLTLKYDEDEDNIYSNEENEFVINKEKKKLFKIVFDEDKIKDDSYIYFYINLEKEDIKTIL